MLRYALRGKKRKKEVKSDLTKRKNPCKSMLIKEVQGLLGARDWNRTSTSLRTADFESAASTNSAIRARGRPSQFKGLTLTPKAGKIKV